MSAAPSVVVFDASAVITWALKRPGYEAIKAQLLNPAARVFLHRQNAVEVWYQTHRRGALDAFLIANPQRIQADGRADLTGVDFDDPAMFDPAAGQMWADTQIADIEAAGVVIVGDETFPDLWKRAGELKSKYRRVSLADCFGVALAVELNAPFWTSDRHELTALDAARVVSVHFIR